MQKLNIPDSQIPIDEYEQGIFTVAWYLFLDSIKDWIFALDGRVTAIENGGGSASGGVNFLQEIILTATQAIPNTANPPVANQILVVFVDQDATGGWEITWGTDYETDTPVQLDPNPLTKNSFTFVGTTGAKWRLISAWQPTL